MNNITLTLKEVTLLTEVGITPVKILWVNTLLGPFYSVIGQNNLRLTGRRTGDSMSVFHEGVLIFTVNMEGVDKQGDTIASTSWLVRNLRHAIRVIAAFTGVNGLVSTNGDDDACLTTELPRGLLDLIGSNQGHRAKVTDLFKNYDGEDLWYIRMSEGPVVSTSKTAIKGALSEYGVADVLGDPRCALTCALENGMVPSVNGAIMCANPIYVLSSRVGAKSPTITEYEIDDECIDIMTRRRIEEDEWRHDLWMNISDEVGVIQVLY